MRGVADAGGGHADTHSDGLDLNLSSAHGRDVWRAAVCVCCCGGRKEQRQVVAKRWGRETAIDFGCSGGLAPNVCPGSRRGGRDGGRVGEVLEGTGCRRRMCVYTRSVYTLTRMGWVPLAPVGRTDDGHQGKFCRMAAVEWLPQNLPQNAPLNTPDSVRACVCVRLPASVSCILAASQLHRPASPSHTAINSHPPHWPQQSQHLPYPARSPYASPEPILPLPTEPFLPTLLPRPTGRITPCTVPPPTSLQTSCPCDHRSPTHAVQNATFQCLFLAIQSTRPCRVRLSTAARIV